MNADNPSRRRFFQLAAAGAACAAFAGDVLAAAAPKLSVDDPTAKALGYTEDASKIDASKEATYKKGSACASCALFQAAQAAGGYAPCGAFGGKQVNAKGWCRAYAAKA
ncbi:MAG TPA: high-potential iron-sulfur protein [Nevskiaceae bacterium]|nr:high-potential iron-sulfur protein [Nevskiaceae bacterium]